MATCQVRSNKIPGYYFVTKTIPRLVEIERRREGLVGSLLHLPQKAICQTLALILNLPLSHGRRIEGRGKEEKNTNLRVWSPITEERGWGRRKRGLRKCGATTATGNSTTRRSWCSIRRRSTSSAMSATRSSPPLGEWSSTSSRSTRRPLPSKEKEKPLDFCRSFSMSYIFLVNSWFELLAVDRLGTEVVI